MHLTIAPYSSTDRAAVVSVMVGTGMFADEDAAFLEDVLDQHAGADGDGSRCLVARVDDAVVGAALARAEEATDRVWDLTMIGVRPDRQRDGVGVALMRAVEAALADAARLVVVRTSSTAQFAGARGFYDRLGYDEVARVADYWTDGDDLVVFRRDLRDRRDAPVGGRG
ncbi:GNAT family N-acetyltransferase [Curtobacterium sp. 'Ferrero']|uniref:GNAT family N-acetyltransferase n=1 Tax=Curtobacterium sp. 'Ferrero' TaxID=2033654 RepID=UPI0011446724|nr:GNAT family N-acetyltransferase [Curtobacterium sp. 'Ferrero']